MMSYFDYMLDDLFNDRFFTPAKKANVMKTDIREIDNNYELNIELPGYSKENIKLGLKDGYLTIEADQSSESNEANGKLIRKERYKGHISRSFYIGKNYTHENIQAKFNNGELIITLPKELPEKVQQNHFITIE